MRVKCQRFHRSASPHGMRLQRVGERVWERGRVGWSHRHWRPSPSPSHKKKSKIGKRARGVAKFKVAKGQH
jgi:hypothetical protein